MRLCSCLKGERSISALSCSGWALKREVKVRFKWREKVTGLCAGQMPAGDALGATLQHTWETEAGEEGGNCETSSKVFK